MPGPVRDRIEVSSDHDDAGGVSAAGLRDDVAPWSRSHLRQPLLRPDRPGYWLRNQRCAALRPRSRRWRRSPWSRRPGYRLYRTAVDPAIRDLPRSRPGSPCTTRPATAPSASANASTNTTAASDTVFLERRAPTHTGVGTRGKPVRCAASSAGWMVPIVDLGRRMGRLDRRERLEDLVGVHGVPGNDPAVAWLQ